MSSIAVTGCRIVKQLPGAGVSRFLLRSYCRPPIGISTVGKAIGSCDFLYRDLLSHIVTRPSSSLSESASQSARSARSAQSAQSAQPAQSAAIHHEERPKRRLDIAIVGAPNAGKSQLLNTLTGTPIAAVSRKRHTTRSSTILATHHDPITNTQLVFIDTPGFVTMGNAREERLYGDLVNGAMGGMSESDYTLVVVDAAKGMDEDFMEVITMLMMRAQHCAKGRAERAVLREDGTLLEKDSDGDGGAHAEEEEEWEEVGEKFAIVLNKVDLVNPKNKLLQIAHDLGLVGDACVRYNYDSDASSANTRDINEQDLPTSLSSTTTTTTTTNTNNQQQHSNATTTPTPTHPGDTTTDEQFPDHETFTQHLTPPQITTLEAQYPSVFYTSALQHHPTTCPGVSDLLAHLVLRATPTLDFAIPPNDVTPMSIAERIEEIVREKIYRCLHREVPHSVTQINRGVTRGVRKGDGARVVRIDQDLVVRTKSHLKLVNGRGGMTLRRISETARRDLMKLFEKEGVVDVVLNLHVKWSRDSGHTRELEAERSGVTQRHF